MLKIEHKSKVSKYDKILKGFSVYECVVGIPKGKASRDDGSHINNATIGYINERGDAFRHIPARPHLLPGVRRVSGMIVSILRQGMRKSLREGEDFKKTLSRCGLAASGSVKTLITEGLKPALAKSTIERRQKHSGGDHTGDIPLIDTGNYKAHITYAIRLKGK